MRRAVTSLLAMAPLVLCVVLAARGHPAVAEDRALPVRWTRALVPLDAAGLKRALATRVALPDGQGLTASYGGAEHAVVTCRDYGRAKAAGWTAESGYDRATASFFVRQCDALVLLQRAKPSRVSHVGGFSLSPAVLDQLPPTLATDLSGEHEDAIADAARAGRSWRQFNPSLVARMTGDSSLRVEEGDGMARELSIAGAGDLDGDGVEDLILFVATYATEGTFRTYDHVVLTRRASGVRLERIEAP